MPAFPRLAAAGLALLLAAGGARAATVARVDIRGLDAPMAQNVRNSLSLVDAIGKDVSGRRLAYLLREAEAETRSALEPFGYYSPTIDVQRTPAGQVVVVTVTVARGTPVRVRRSHVAITGDGADDRALQQVVATFAPATGAVFDQGVYETSKARVVQRLSERGYFDADFASHRVEVTRAANAADIDLTWTSGARYALGAATFAQTPKPVIRDRLLHKLVRWTPGDPYQQGDLDRLRQSLAALDYFSRIEVEPLPDKSVDHRVPVQVTLTPARRSIYTAGVS